MSATMTGYFVHGGERRRGIYTCDGRRRDIARWFVESCQESATEREGVTSRRKRGLSYVTAVTRACDHLPVLMEGVVVGNVLPSEQQRLSREQTA